MTTLFYIFLVICEPINKRIMHIGISIMELMLVRTLINNKNIDDNVTPKMKEKVSFL